MAWSDAARAAAAEARRAKAKGKSSLSISAPKGGWPKSLRPAEASALMQRMTILQAHHPYQGEGFYGKNRMGRVKFFASSKGGSKTWAKYYATVGGLARDGARKSKFGG